MGKIDLIEESAFRNLVERADSKKHILNQCGLSYDSYNIRKVKKRIEELGIDISHFSGRALQGEYKDLEGLNFGDWTVLGRSAKRHKGTMWECKCSCGIVKTINGGDLKSGKSRGCSNCKGKKISLTSRKFTLEEKFCPWCNRTRRLEDFGKVSSRPSGRKPYCKICTQLAKHNMRYDIYFDLFNKQNGVCAIEGCSLPIHSIDHDHKCCNKRFSCGKCIRGLLCRSCNLALGFLEENEEKVEGLLVYIKESKL